jgi:transposase
LARRARGGQRACLDRLARPGWLGPAAQKKSLTACERNNRKRAWYWRRLKGLDQRRLRFLDEAGVNRALTRLRGRAPRGERVCESVPRNYGAQTSLIGALSLSGVEAVMTVEGAVDTAVFTAYIEQVLSPTIERREILVLDNVSAHHASRIEEVAAPRGARVIWRSPYSPDSSPIELLWAKIKGAMRTAKARTQEGLERALQAALARITKSDCLGWFRHCGYRVTSNRN